MKTPEDETKTAEKEGETVEKERSEDDETLFEKICSVTDLDREEDESAEDFKVRVVRHFADTYPNTDEGNAAFEQIDSEVTDWVDSATEIHRSNKGARNKKRLPEIDGLEEDEEPKSKRGGAGKEKAEKKPREKKEKPEPKGRDPEANRFFRVAEFLVKDPDLTADELVTAASKTGYSERSVRRVHEAWAGITGALKKHNKL